MTIRLKTQRLAEKRATISSLRSKLRNQTSSLKADIQTLLLLQIRPSDNPPELVEKVKQIAIRHS